MKEIKSTNGYTIQVSDDKFEELSKYRWHVGKNPKRKALYASAYIGWDKVKNKSKRTSMHRMIMGAQKYSKTQIDHIDGNSLNNCTENLRVCTNQENNFNKKKYATNKTGFKGVYYNKEKQMYQASIKVNYKQKFLGRFDTAIEAAEAYDNYIINDLPSHLRQYAQTNF